MDKRPSNTNLMQTTPLLYLYSLFNHTPGKPFIYGTGSYTPVTIHYPSAS